MRWLALLGLAVLSSGCGGESRDNWPDDRPRLDEVRFLGQNPRNAWGLVFALDFADTGGDLNAGKLRLKINDDEVSVISLMTLFSRQSPVIPPDATEGTFEVEADLEGRVTSGQELDFSFVLQDARGRASNEPRIVLRAVIPESEDS